jgi:serine/threonine-protein kinase HipA
MEQKATIQIHAGSQWRNAAEIGFREPERGIRGSVWLSYMADCHFELNIFDQPDGSVRDCRALSVRHPVALEYRILDGWPAWLLDLLPPGTAWRRITATNEVAPCPR